jgi:hypothetical protein
MKMSIVQANVPPSPLSRQGRELARIGQATEIAVARAIAIAEVEAARLDGLQLITARALQGVALTSQLEQQLAQIVPVAAPRLQGIGDMHALASAEVVAEGPRRLSCRR